MNKCIWPGKSTQHETPWGHEVRWSGIFVGKELHITAGGRTSLKFYEAKQEMLFVAKGILSAEIADERHWIDPIQHPARRVILKRGEILNVQASCPYRLSAIEDSIVYEIGDGSYTAVRLADDYGRPIDEKALKTHTFVPPDNDEGWKP
jgi:hypothetical protein